MDYPVSSAASVPTKNRAATGQGGIGSRCLRSILQVSPADFIGGAEGISRNLHRAYQALGHRSWLAVGRLQNEDPSVFVIKGPDSTNWWTRAWLAIDRRLSPAVGKIRGAGRFQRIVRLLAVPSRLWRVLLGHEDFYSPGTWSLLKLCGARPEILHCHNLHGNYFDLEALPWLSQQIPVVVTLHDAWLLSGHCAHSFECERWRTGCGQCPGIKIYPPMIRDATAYNWKRKADIYRRSRLYIATPSQWLMQKVEQSMLSPAIVAKRVIPNGIDLSVFQPYAREAARAAVDVPRDVKVVLFMISRRIRHSWKDWETLDAAIQLVAEKTVNHKIWFVGIGAKHSRERLGNATIVRRPYQRTPEALARYYQAADLYVHCAHVDTFPNMVIEALACGTPVVATNVGGIPEQIRPMTQIRSKLDSGPDNTNTTEYPTGILVPPRSVATLAESIVYLLNNDGVRKKLGENAAADAKNRFDQRQMVQNYLDWYQEIIASSGTHV